MLLSKLFALLHHYKFNLKVVNWNALLGTKRLGTLVYSQTDFHNLSHWAVFL